MNEAILLSGGVNSIALAFLRRPETAFTIDYGQRAAEAEIAASSAVAQALGLRHDVLRVDCSSLGSGKMAGSVALKEAPIVEWWPYRNQFIVTVAAMRAIAIGARRLLVGSVASDASHRDGTEGFFARLSDLLAYQEGGLTVEAPALDLSTVELVRRSGVPRDLLAWSHSCHVGNFACGHCPGCVKHYYVMQELYGIAY